MVQDAAVLGQDVHEGRARGRVGLRRQRPRQCRSAALVRKEVLSLQVDPRSPERGQFSFLQDLLRQVAYETLSRKERKARHLAAAASTSSSNGRTATRSSSRSLPHHVLSALELDPDAAMQASSGSDVEATARPCGRTRCVAWRERERPAVLRAGARACRTAPCARRAPRAGGRAGPTLRAAPTSACAHFEQAIAGFEEQQLTHPGCARRSPGWASSRGNSRVTSSRRSAYME